LEALYVLAVSTGMREGELLGLKWADVDLEAGTLRVRRTLTRHGGKVALGEPKTKKSRRTVRLTPRAVESLKRDRARQAGEKLKAGPLYGDQGLVFAGESGGLINPSNLRQRSFLPLLKRAELPGITFHDLRHTCASLLFQRNVHPKFVPSLGSRLCTTVSGGQIGNAARSTMRGTSSGRWGPRGARSSTVFAVVGSTSG
ncbi:MAG: site-specific integrase, partial [Actinomycetota bacterium]|nr:site-specific integrase [Actinomycetota bacterium]